MVTTQPIQDLDALEARARVEMGTAEWADLGGSDHEWSLRRNSLAFQALRGAAHPITAPERVRHATSLFGVPLALPFLAGPAPYRPLVSGTTAISGAVRDAGTVMVLQESLDPAALVSHAAAPFRQVYFRGHRATEDFARRVADQGARAIFLTIGVRAAPVRERALRLKRREVATTFRESIACHLRPVLARGRMFRFDPNDIGEIQWRHPEFTWADLDRMRRYVRLPLVLKGILTGEDTEEAVAHGVDGVVVSNHGGRAMDRTPAPIEVLSEVVQAAQGRLRVLVDGGFRRGDDILAAIVAGADAVLVVRPFFWSLQVLGNAGPARVIEILRGELQAAMVARGMPQWQAGPAQDRTTHP